MYGCRSVVVFVRGVHTLTRRVQSIDASVSVYMSLCAHEEHRRVGYPPMDFHYDAMALAAGAIFIEFIL